MHNKVTISPVVDIARIPSDIGIKVASLNEMYASCQHFNKMFLENSVAHGAVFVAQDNNRSIGLISATPLSNRTTYNLNVLLINPSYRNKNVGSALLSTLFETLKYEGVSRLQGEYAIHQFPHAKPFLKRHGFNHIVLSENMGSKYDAAASGLKYVHFNKVL